MTFGFHPYSKEQQLGAREKPQPKKKRYPEKKRKKRQPQKLEVYKGRTIPRRATRGRITARQYNEALRQHGESCYVCGRTDAIEAHHVRFRSDGGRGQWRNIRFLCPEHHRGNYSPHKNAELRRELEQLRESLYGAWYWADVYDLFLENLIPNTTDEAFENFMRGEADEKAAAEDLDPEGNQGGR